MAKLFDFLDENILIFVVLSGRFHRLERDSFFTVAFCFDLNNVMSVRGVELSQQWQNGYCEGDSKRGPTLPRY